MLQTLISYTPPAVAPVVVVGVARQHRAHSSAGDCWGMRSLPRQAKDENVLQNARLGTYTSAGMGAEV